MPSPVELITVREAARRLGVSDTAVRKAKAAGRITFGEPDANGWPRCEWPSVRDQWEANTDAGRRSHVGSRGGARRRDDEAATLIPVNGPAAPPPLAAEPPPPRRRQPKAPPPPPVEPPAPEAEGVHRTAAELGAMAAEAARILAPAVVDPVEVVLREQRAAALAVPGPGQADRPAEWLEPQAHGGALKRQEAAPPSSLEVDEDGNPVISSSMSMADANRVKAIWSARQAALDYGEKAGELVPITTVRAQAFKAARAARDALQTMEDRLAPILASLTDLNDVRRALRDDIRRTCERIAADTAAL